MDSLAVTSLSRFKLSGVSSNTQETTKAGKKSIAYKITPLRATQSGAPNIGKTVPAT